MKQITTIAALLILSFSCENNSLDVKQNSISEVEIIEFSEIGKSNTERNNPKDDQPYFGMSSSTQYELSNNNWTITRNKLTVLFDHVIKYDTGSWEPLSTRDYGEMSINNIAMNKDDHLGIAVYLSVFNEPGNLDSLVVKNNDSGDMRTNTFIVPFSLQNVASGKIDIINKDEINNYDIDSDEGLNIKLDQMISSDDRSYLQLGFTYSTKDYIITSYTSLKFNGTSNTFNIPSSKLSDIKVKINDYVIESIKKLSSDDNVILDESNFQYTLGALRVSGVDNSAVNTIDKDDNHYNVLFELYDTSRIILNNINLVKSN